jgi:DNA-binding MarR family transcriptional regulator
MPRVNDPRDLIEAGEVLHGLLTVAVRQLPRDVSLTAASTLATIERTGPRRITDLAVTEGVAQPSMTALITTLERAGLVERRPDPQDQRVVLVALTGAGADYRRARRQAGAAAFAELIAKLPPAEADAVRAAIPALRHLRELSEEQRATGTGPAVRGASRG